MPHPKPAGDIRSGGPHLPSVGRNSNSSPMFQPQLEEAREV